MLKGLKLRNFRTHEKLDMEFHEGVNVIWGLPGSGKTNILRSIDWVVSNSPKFERVHSHFAKSKETSVELEFSDGSVELTKTLSTNKYEDGNGNSYSYTGGSVPNPIAQILNLNEINISKQLDPHFLITSTPGEVGKTINRITKIEKVDEWVSKLTTKANNAKWSVEALEKEITASEKELKHYDGIEDLEKEVQKYGKLDDKCFALRDRIQSLSIDVDRLKNLKSRIDELNDLNMDAHIEEFDNMNTQYVNAVTRTDRMTRKVHQYHVLLRRKQKLDFLMEDINFDSLAELTDQIKTTDRRYRHLDAMVRTSNQMVFTATRLFSAKENYIEAVKDLGICPICQSEMSDEHIKELEDSL